MSYLTDLLAEYAVMGGRRGDDPPLDGDDMFDFNLESDSCSCSECGDDCSCDENNCSGCGIQFEDDDEMEPDMDGGAEDNGMRRRDGDEMEPDMDDDEMGMDAGSEDDLDMKPDDEMGGDIESRVDDLETKLNDVLQKFAQVIAQDMTNDMGDGEDDLDMKPDGEDDIDLDVDAGDNGDNGDDGDKDDLGMDAGGEDDIDMDAGPEKESTGEFDMDAFDREHDDKPMDRDETDDMSVAAPNINPELRRKLDRMKDQKELQRLLMSGKMPKKMSFKAARKFMQEYEDDLPDTVNQDDHDNEVDGKFNTDTYGNRDGKKRLNRRYRKHRVAETGRGEGHEWGYDEPDLKDMRLKQFSGEYVQHPRDGGRTIVHIFRNGRRIDAYKSKTVAMR